jgi:hypothetical protein
VVRGFASVSPGAFVLDGDRVLGVFKRAEQPVCEVSFVFVLRVCALPVTVDAVPPCTSIARLYVASHPSYCTLHSYARRPALLFCFHGSCVADGQCCMQKRAVIGYPLSDDVVRFIVDKTA